PTRVQVDVPRPPAPIPAQAPVQDTAGIANAYADANADRRPPKDERPLFQAMFTDAPRRNAVAPVVGQLWTPAAAPTEPAAVRTLELFPDARPTARKIFGGS